MHTIGLMGAMEDEIAPLYEAMTDKSEETIGGVTFYKGMLENKRAVLCCAGIGKAQAAAATQLLCTHFGVDAVVFSGIAGNMTDRLDVGDVVIGRTLMYHDGEPRMFAETPTSALWPPRPRRAAPRACAALPGASPRATSSSATAPPSAPSPKNAARTAWRWRAPPWRTSPPKTACRSWCCAP